MIMYGSVAFRMSDLDHLEEYIENTLDSKWFRDIKSNKDNILDLAKILQSYDKMAWQTRIERNQIDVYTNDKNLYDDISSKFSFAVRKRFEPSDDIPLVDGNIVKAKKLPHDRYRYKVYLKPHKLHRDQDAKMQYLSWVDSQSPRISISHSVKQWFIYTDWNWDRRYIWVEDESTLLMLKLRNSDVFGKVYEYQLCDK